MPNFFTKHLRDVNETYLVHFKHAMFFALHTFKTSIALIIHSFLPFILTTTGSKTIGMLYNLMSIRVKIANRKMKKQIAIIGLGASGIMALQNIVEQGDNFEIHIFDKNFHSLGTAYNTCNAQHFLNVRAGNMSAIESDANHFVDWLKINGWNFTENDFVPRPIYGLYLKSLLHTTIEIAKEKNIIITFFHTEVENISQFENYFIINKDIYSQCYLSIGMEFANKGKNFWCVNQTAIIESIANHKEIHIVGTGLSAFDAIFTIMLANFNGKIILHSRTGKLTMPHQFYAPTEIPNITLENFNIKTFIKMCKMQNPYAIIDSIRKITPLIWQSFSVAKKQSIIRHLFKYWNKYRHRSPANQYNKIIEMIRNNIIEITTTKPPENAIYCTGFNLQNLTTLEQNLITNQIIKQDDLQMGIVSIHKNFHIIGGKNFGTLFETMAIPELRLQSKAIKI